MTITLAAARNAAAPRPLPDRRQRLEFVALATLLGATAFAYLWNLAASGWANSFYAAAVQAGSQSWKAFFFGSSDAANSITVDKPPASLWLMELSARVFGLSSWSLLVPQALLGVASVALLWWIVRRWFGPAAGLLAGLVLTCTPVAALMFRFDNPDALLVFLMTAAAGTVLAAVESGRTRWLVVSGALVGFGFLTKQLQVMLVVPPLAATYLIAGPPRLGKRLVQLVVAGVSVVVAAGWWVLTVELWPASSRPFIGGSQHNSILELTFGYNGFGRLSGSEIGSVVPGGPGGAGRGPGGGGGMWGSTGITRMFTAEQGGQIAWLIPAALVLLAVAVVLRGKSIRTDGQRATMIVFGGWLLVTGLVFSFMAGIFHAYYTVALAPAIAAVVGAGAVLAWRSRNRLWVRASAALGLLLTGATAWMLLDRTADFVPWLRWVVVAAAVVGAGLVLVPAALQGRLGVLTALVVALAALSGPAAYAADTVTTPHHGPIVSAGPNAGFGPGGMGGPPGTGRHGHRWFGPGGSGGPAQAGMPRFGGGSGPRRGPGGGGPFGSSTPSRQIVAMLSHNSDAYTWAAATVGADNASGYQLATRLPVMPIGGFNGTDPSPTLAQFQQYVAQGKIHYFIVGGGMFGGGGGGQRGSDVGAQITQWVKQHYHASTVDGVTLYDLSG